MPLLLLGGTPDTALLRPAAVARLTAAGLAAVTVERPGLRLVYRLMRGSGDVGVPLLWCPSCLLGIGLCAVAVPEGATVVPREGPEPCPRRSGVPNFRPVPPE